MNTKLTLTIDQTVIQKAKLYAKKQQRSLSDIIESYLKYISRENSKTEEKYSKVVRSLKGSFKAPADFDYKEELKKALKKKHLKND